MEHNTDTICIPFIVSLVYGSHYSDNEQTRGPFHKSLYERFLLYKFVELVLNYRSNEFVALTNLCEMGPSPYGRTPQLCSPLTAMLNRPTTHPKKTGLYTWNPPNTNIFEQHISLSIKRDQKNNIKTTKKKSFFDFSKGSLEPSFSRQLDLSGFPSKVKFQIGITN